MVTGPAGSDRRKSRFSTGQRLAGPQRGDARHVIEIAAVLDAACGLVVIATDDGDRIELPHEIDDRIGRRAIPDEIAEDDDMIPGAVWGGIEHRFERLEIGVNIRQDQVAHGLRSF